MKQEPELFECKPLRAKLSAMGCLVNRVTAMAYVKFPNIGPGLLKPCLSCKIGRRVRAILPPEGE